MNDVIVLYHGGGYDGCVWEWNVGIFDKDCEFHPIHATGRYGIKTNEDALAAVEAILMTNGDVVPAGEDITLPSGKTFWLQHGSIFDFSGTGREKENAAWSEWAIHSPAFNGGVIMGIVKTVVDKDIEMSIPVEFKCSFCERWSQEPEFPEELREGNGGVGVQIKDTICSDCDHLARCGHCGDFDSRRIDETDDKEGKAEWVLDSDDGYCKKCAPEADEGDDDEGDDDGPPYGDENPLLEMDHNQDPPDPPEPGGSE